MKKKAKSETQLLVDSLKAFPGSEKQKKIIAEINEIRIARGADPIPMKMGGSVKYNRGGVTVGPSHDEGGMKYENRSTGEILELEGGEGIINKHSIGSNKKVKLDGQSMTVCEAGSYLNQMEGNGRSFECGGKMKGDTYRTGGSVSKLRRPDNLDEVYGAYGIKVRRELKNPPAEVVAQGRKRNYGSDYCKADKKQCSGNLGIDRIDMPQIRSEDFQAFKDFLGNRSIRVDDDVMEVGDLRPIQKEINMNRMGRMMEKVEAGEFDGNPFEIPILVSNDNYVIDGHHRWATLAWLDPTNTIKVKRIGTSAKDVLRLAKSFPKTQYEAFAKGGCLGCDYMAKGGIVWKGYEFEPKIKRTKGKVPVEIYGSGKFNKSRYDAILGDFDGDGLANADDLRPRDKSSSKLNDYPPFSESFKTLLELKEDLDDQMLESIEELKSIAPPDSKIYARTKTPYSILKKLIEKRLIDVKNPKRGLTDVIGTTLVVETPDQVMDIDRKFMSGELGEVIDKDDFYAEPLAGYRAMHYIVIRNGIPVEVQVKTFRQKAINELSHQAYKDGVLDRERLEAATELAQMADVGDPSAQKEYDKLIKKIDASYFRRKMEEGGTVDEVSNPMAEELSWTEYQDQIASELSGRLGMSRGDAEGMLMAHDFRVLQSFQLDRTPGQAVDAILADDMEAAGVKPQSQFAEGGSTKKVYIGTEDIFLRGRIRELRDRLKYVKRDLPKGDYDLILSTVDELEYWYNEIHKTIK